MKRSASASIRSALPHLDGSADLLELIQQGSRTPGSGGGDGAAGSVRVVNLGLGQSPFPPPPGAADLLRRRADAGRYSPSEGTPELRCAVADFHRWPGGPDRVIVGPGCRSLLFALLLAFNSGRRVFVAAPAWSACGPQCSLLGADIIPVRARADNAWKIRPTQLRKLAISGLKLLILANPSNPSGQCYSPQELADLADVLAAEDFTVVADETYAMLRFDGKPHKSLADFYPQGTVVLSSLSKWASLAGWRIGYALFPWQLAELQESVASVLSHTAPCAPTPQQLASADLLRNLTDPSSSQTALVPARRVLRALGNFCAKSFNECGAAGVRVAPAQAGFFLLLDLSDMAGDLQCLGLRTSGEVCNQLLRDTGVLLLPGDAFLLPVEQLVLRLCFVDFDGEAAVDAASVDAAAEAAEADCPEILDDRFVLTRCQPTADAVLRVRDWLSGAPARAAAARDWEAEVARVGRELATCALLGALEACCCC